MFTFSKKASTVLTVMMSILLVGMLYNCDTTQHEEATNQSLFSKHIQLPDELVSAKTTRGTAAESSALTQQIGTLWDQANAAYTSGNYTQAVDVLKQIEELDAAFETQSESSFYYALGNAQLKQGNAEAAQRSFANVRSGELTEDAVWKRALSLVAVEEEQENATAAMQSIANSSHAKSSLAQNIMYEMSNMSEGGLNPVINVVGGVVEGEIPFTIQLNSNGTTSTNPIISYLWSFGDGQNGNGTSVSHTYYKPGIYTISLVVFDYTGQAASAEIQIAVSAPKGNYELIVPLSPSLDEDVTIQVGTVINEATLQAGLNKVSYLKFNTEDVFGTITKTELELSYEGFTAAAGNIQVHRGSSAVWNEGSITASNAPIKGALLDEVNQSYSLGQLLRWNLNSTAKEKFTLIVSTPSNNTFTFGSSEYYFEDGKPKLVLQVDNTANEGQYSLNPPADPIFFEAECATVGSNWTRRNQGSASNNKYLLYPGMGQEFTSPPTSSSKMVKFQFLITQAAEYDLYTRILVNNNINNSFWVRINNGTWIKFSDIPRKAAFQWVHVYDNNSNGIPVTYNFAAGFHTIDIAVMEDGTKLDKLGLIGAGGEMPIGEGPAAGNCQGGNSSDSGSTALLVGSSRDGEANTDTYSFDYESANNLTEDIEVYPNPFFSEVTLDMQMAQEQVNVRVFDLAGKLVTEQLNIEADQRVRMGAELPSGNYIVHVDAGNQTFYKKVQKIAE